MHRKVGRRVRRALMLIVALTLVGGIVGTHEPLRRWILTRPATPEEVTVFLGPPHHLLSPTGWHATPRWASGSVHRWRSETAVGTWTGYFRTEVAEGWVRRRLALDGSPVGGTTFFTADGRIDYQSGPETRREPPWLWGEQDLTEEEMAARGDG